MAKRPTNNRRPGTRPSRPSGQRRQRLIASSRGEEEMLREFADDTNNFYVDEQQERRKQRRQEKVVKKQQKKADKRKPLSPTRRRLIRVLSYAAIVTVVLVVGVILSLTVLFKTQVYEITGNTKYAESDIISAGGITQGENIFLAPKRPAERRIKNEFAYVEEVHVSFRIPDAIKIDIVEAVEGYLVKMSDTDYLLISTAGRILNRVADPAQYDLPIFIGPKLVSGDIGDYVSYEDETIVSIIGDITRSFADNGYQGITEINATDTANVTFTYDNRIRVKLGIPEELDYKVRTAMTIINENLDKNQTGSTKGILDVSRCNSTRRSYFNEQEINPTVAPTQNPSEQPTEAGDGDWYGYDDDYDWYSYDDDDWYGYDDSDDWYDDDGYDSYEDWSYEPDDGDGYYGE